MAALLAVGCAPEDRWEPVAHEDRRAFPYGVQAGDATPDGVVVSVQTDEPTVSLLVVCREDDAWIEVADVQGVVVERGRARVELTGLAPDRVHAFVFLTVDGRRSEIGSFRTALAAGGWRRVRFGATSCIGDKPCRNLAHASSQDLDFFALLGDTVYADGSVTPEEFRAEWRAGLAGEGMRAITAATSIVATLDDHEIRDNWTAENLDSERREVGMQAYRDALPQRTGPAGSVYRVLSWGDVLDVIVLDARSRRAGGRYLGAEQLEWLKDALRSPARFKVILNSVPITDMDGLVWDGVGYIARDDGWYGFPADRDDILSFVADEGIEGVLWLSGDHHWGQVSRVDAEGGPGRGAWEVLCGPSGSAPGSPGIGPDDDQVDLLLLENNCVIVELDPDAGTAHVSFLGDDGRVLAERTLTP